MKKRNVLVALGLVLALLTGALAGCSQGETTVQDTIYPVTREDGSGTRGAFIELFGIEQKDADGNKIDYTTDMAEITNSTSVMMTTVAGNKASIGYVSLGSLGDDVKAVEIDGVVPTVENIKNGTYKVSRPFNIVTSEQVSPQAQDFIDFILSDGAEDCGRGRLHQPGQHRRLCRRECERKDYGCRLLLGDAHHGKAAGRVSGHQRQPRD